MNINKIILEAVKQKSSDIHICVGQCVKFRVFGELKSQNEHVKLSEREVENFIEDLVGKETLEKIEYSLDFAKEIDKIARIRCNIYRERGNFACAIRIVSREIPSCDDIKIPKSLVKKSEKNKGLILVTGPTGHGKSTTLGSLIGRINENFCKHIITLEEPIEFFHEHKNSLINQRELGVDIPSFPQGLKDALRQDPDIILVGEMRDVETISTALTSAETGHLVMSTLHTMDCASTISRVVDVFPVDGQSQIRLMLADVIEAIVSQRLVKLKDGTRCAVYEVMTATPAIRSLIRENKAHQIYSQMQLSAKDGMQTLDESLIELYKTGNVDKAELYAICRDSAWIEKNIRKVDGDNYDRV